VHEEEQEDINNNVNFAYLDDNDGDFVDDGSEDSSF